MHFEQFSDKKNLLKISYEFFTSMNVLFSQSATTERHTHDWWYRMSRIRESLSTHIRNVLYKEVEEMLPINSYRISFAKYSDLSHLNLFLQAGFCYCVNFLIIAGCFCDLLNLSLGMFFPEANIKLILAKYNIFRFQELKHYGWFHHVDQTQKSSITRFLSVHIFFLTGNLTSIWQTSKISEEQTSFQEAIRRMEPTKSEN